MAETQILRILFWGTEGASCAAIHKGKVKNRPMGWCLWVSPGGLNCYRWRRQYGDTGEPSLEKLCKGNRRGPGWSLQRDIVCPGSSRSHHHPTSPLCPGLDTQRVATHRTKKSEDQTHGVNGQKLKSSSQGLCSGSEHVPTKGKTCWQPSGLLGRAASTPHTIKNATSLLQISILPCWATASAPCVLLLPSLASSPAALEIPGQHCGAASCAHQPHNRDSKRCRDGTRSRGIRPAATWTSSGREEKMESGG